MATSVRAEDAADRAAVRDVNLAAFEVATEADLVDALRAEPGVLSIVAEVEGIVVGHIMFSPVSLAGRAGPKIAGLAPMAVVPARQRQGVGSALVRDGLARCRALGYGAVVVVGHPTYYPRFGFVPASRFGITCRYEVPDDVFMAVELMPGYLDEVSGGVDFHPAFEAT